MSDGDDLKERLKQLIIQAANLQNVDPNSIDESAPIFGEGLGLDSLDALQLAMSLEEHLGVRLPEGDEGREALGSVNALAAFVRSHRKP